MLATRVHQKDSIFYFISYKAADLLEKVRFTSRYYYEGEEIEAEKPKEDDEVAKFIAGIERSEKGFQRALNKQKIKQIVNFYQTAVTQPLIPGTVLLFTEETLRFQKMNDSESVGYLSEPNHSSFGYGVNVARKGGLGASDVINTRGPEEVLAAGTNVVRT